MSNEQTPSSNSQEDFEKFKYKVEIFKWIIGSVVLVIVTTIIDWGFKDRAAGLQELQQYDKYATELIVMNDNLKNKRMLAQYFSTVTPSEKLRAGWKLYFDQVDKEYQKLLADDSIIKVEYEKLKLDSLNKSPVYQLKLQKVEAQMNIHDKILNEPVLLPNAVFTSTIPTVYIQYSHSENRPNANSIAYKINAMGFKAPGIELVKNSGVSNNEIRYFYASDLNAVNSLKDFLKQQKLDANIKYIPALSGKAKQGTIELWLK